MLKPKALQLGDFIGIVSPSGPVPYDRLSAGVARIQSWGFRTVIGPSVLASRGYLAGSDVERAADLNSLWANPNVAGIICARGGYGSMRILDLIDWEMIESRPKFFCGFSDITALHIAMQQKAKLVTFHGPMVGAFGEAVEFNSESMQAAMRRIQPNLTIPWPTQGGSPRYTIRGGVAEGVLMGGNLSLVCSLLGTPFEPDFRGKIILLEEVNEAPYRIDRMLTQLFLADKFRGAAGILFGDSPTCMNDPDGKPSPSLLGVLEERLGPLGVPVVYGFPCGHADHRATVPLGVRARLDGANGALTLLEPALSLPK